MSKQTSFTEKEMEKIKNAVNYAKRCVICVDTPIDKKNTAFKYLSEIQTLFAQKEKKTHGSQN